MARERSFVGDMTFKAGADLSTHQFKFVKISATDTVILVAAATDRPIGILQNKPKQNEAAAVRPLLGQSKLIVDGSGTAIVAGDYVGPNASALGIKKATPDNVVVGIALEGATVANAVIGVLMVPLNWFRTAA